MFTPAAAEQPGAATLTWDSDLRSLSADRPVLAAELRRNIEDSQKLLPADVVVPPDFHPIAERLNKIAEQLGHQRRPPAEPLWQKFS